MIILFLIISGFSRNFILWRTITINEFGIFKAVD